MGSDTSQNTLPERHSTHDKHSHHNAAHQAEHADKAATRESLERSHPFHTCLLDNMKQHRAHLRQHENQIASILFAHDIKIHSDSPYKSWGDTMHRRSTLEDVARKKLSIPQMKAFEHDINTFENRAAADKLPPEKITSFYNETERLLKEKPMHYSLSQRANLALELVHHAADPESVRQGFSPTCNVSSIEFRMLAKDPQAVAKLTADVVHDGTFTTKDGTRLLDNWHSLQPGQSDSGRDMLDKLVQTTLVNCHWERHKAYDEDTSYYRYEHAKELGGDRIYRYNMNGSREALLDDKTGLPINDPQLTSPHLHDIYNQAARTEDERFSIANANARRRTDCTPSTTTEDCTYVNSAHALHEDLVRGERQHLYPMEIQVHTANNPDRKQTLKNDPYAPMDDNHFGWHAIAIKSYNAKTHTVKIHNSWGKEADVNISLEELYRATMSPKGWRFSTDD